MNFKTITVCIATTAALVATAQVQAPNSGMFGKGVAKNEDATAEFQFRLGKNNEGQVRGQLTFNAKLNDGNRIVHVELKDPNGLHIESNTGIARGEAILVVRRGNDVERIPGKIVVKAVDVVQPNPNAPESNGDLRRPHDKFEVDFSAARTNMTYKFAGVVVRGDVKVGGN